MGKVESNKKQKKMLCLTLHLSFLLQRAQIKLRSQISQIKPVSPKEPSICILKINMISGIN